MIEGGLLAASEMGLSIEETGNLHCHLCRSGIVDNTGIVRMPVLSLRRQARTLNHLYSDELFDLLP